MKTALVGYSGFVGSTLLRQASFDSLYRSTDIARMVGQSFDLVVCAAAPGQKWLANREPKADKRTISRLIRTLATIDCKQFVLISTVDVFSNAWAVDEQSRIDESVLQPYGLHRLYLEQFVASTFANHLVIRLPGLVGPGLRKNLLYDLLNARPLDAIDGRGIMQFYPMVNLWHDIRLALQNDLRLLHLTAEPLSVAHIAEQGFGIHFDTAFDPPVQRYDVQSNHAALLGGRGRYAYSLRESLLAIRAYAQSERPALRETLVARP